MEQQGIEEYRRWMHVDLGGPSVPFEMLILSHLVFKLMSSAQLWVLSAPAIAQYTPQTWLPVLWIQAAEGLVALTLA